MQYGLIGEHLTHSYSPELHAALGDYRYALRELAPEALEAFFTARDFRAINVTIPYKQAVIPYLDWISPEAERIGAVNTVVNREGRLYGYNTDFAGLSYLAQHAGLSLAGKKVLILGTGGTSRTALAVATAAGAGEVLRVSRHAGEGAVSYDEALSRHANAEILINTTPVGMFPEVEGTPIDLSALPRLSGVLDAIYHPLRTNLVLDATARGIPATGGLAMLVAQAVFASALFFDREPQTDVIERVTTRLTAQKQNLVLIGMPSSGKTTVGRLLAAALGRPFVDTDALLTERLGMPIAAFFAAHGEVAFRREESRLIAELAREDGQIIATGGGAVLDPANLRALRRNGVLILLDRALELLTPTADRPLSAGREALAALFAARSPLYHAAADLTIENNDSPEEASARIRRELKL